MNASRVYTAQDRNMVVPSAEAFYSKIEQFEKEEDGE